MACALSPEFRLAAACAMWPPTNRRTEAIRSAAVGPLDWSRFLRVAARHQVICMVHQGLTQALPDLSPEITREIRLRAATLVRGNLMMASEAWRVQRLFDDAGLPVLFVKGAALAMLAFGNLSLRSGQDIDLLVPRAMLQSATALILNAGYRRFDPPPDISDAKLQLVMPLRKDFGFVHHATGQRIELHWRLFLNPHVIAETSIMASSRVVPLAGSAGLRTLGEQDLFAYLCMHGALHWWNRLKWLADINALLAAASNGDVEHLVRAAEARGAGRAAAQALLLCRRLLATPASDRSMVAFAKSATARWLEKTALNSMNTSKGELAPQESRFGTTRGSLSTFLLKLNWRYWLSELGIHLTNQTDVLAVPLPKQLWFLYPILRLPLWIWRHAKRRL